MHDSINRKTVKPSAEYQNSCFLRAYQLLQPNYSDKENKRSGTI